MNPLLTFLILSLLIAPFCASCSTKNSAYTHKAEIPDVLAQFDPSFTPEPLEIADHPSLANKKPGAFRATYIVSVSEKGEVTSVTVAKTNNREYTEAIKTKILKWKFLPARKAGRPIASQIELPIEFTPLN